jgi:hypothetical protein
MALGHSDLRTTMHYVHLVENLLSLVQPTVEERRDTKAEGAWLPENLAIAASRVWKAL